MRTAQSWYSLNPLAMIGLFWSRVTFSRLTIFYFLFALAHSGLQITLSSLSYTVNSNAVSLLVDIMEAAGFSDHEFALLDNGVLQNCTGVPYTPGACYPVWEASDDTTANYSMPIPSSTPSPFATSTSSAPLAYVTASPVANSTSAMQPLAAPPNNASAPAVAASAPGSDTSSSTTVSAKTSTPSPSSTSLKVENDVAESGFPSATTLAVSDASPSISISDSGGTFKVDLPGGPIRRSVQITSFGNDSLSITGAPLLNHTIQVAVATIDTNCAQVLAFPVQTLRNTKRQDITFILFQGWVFGMSVVALLNESIPHTVAAVITHVFATGWAVFQVVETAQFREAFVAMTTNGECNGVNLLPDYWQQRAMSEIPVLALNCVALLLSAFLSWRLVKLFGWQTFKRIGASLAIHRCYMLVLSLSVSIQLSLFFILAFLGLWVDQLFSGALAQFDPHRTVIVAFEVVLFVLLVPWLVAGWFAVRRELRKPMLAFNLFAGLLILLWGLMFISPFYFWTFTTWMFLATMSSLAVFLTTITLALGIACRINFGKGLVDYLRTDSGDDADQFSHEPPGDPEKIQFPAYSSKLPTFPSRAASPDTLYRTGSQESSVSDDRRVDIDPQENFGSLSRVSSQASTRSDASAHSARGGATLARTESAASTGSTGSQRSRSGGSDGTGRQRWLLE